MFQVISYFFYFTSSNIFRPNVPLAIKHQPATDASYAVSTSSSSEDDDDSEDKEEEKAKDVAETDE